MLGQGFPGDSMKGGLGAAAAAIVHKYWQEFETEKKRLRKNKDDVGEKNLNQAQENIMHERGAVVIYVVCDHAKVDCRLPTGWWRGSL